MKIAIQSKNFFPDKKMKALKESTNDRSAPQKKRKISNAK
jgi:hypothetical protein